MTRIERTAAFLVLVAFGSTVESLGLQTFSDANIRDTIQTLSADGFGGRAPATPGERLTTDYLIDKLKRYGLAPANHGSYLQDVPLVQISASPDMVMTVSRGDRSVRLKDGADVVAFTPRPQKSVSLIDSPMVFVGYGVVAPEYQWNDYAGVDVKGKTVIVLVNDPGYASGDSKIFLGKTMTYYGRWTYKFEEAARQGAAAVLIVHDADAAGYPWGVVRASWSGPREELLPTDAYRPLMQGWLTHDAAVKVLAMANLSLADLSASAGRRGFRPVPLDAKATVILHSQIRAIMSHNVVAFVNGSQRPREVVVYSAHWDHFGTKRGPTGVPQIYHGAIDNASGVAGLLELARVFTQQKPAPARSVLFLATTGEEKGLLGASYYVRHPLFPLESTVADLNMDILNTNGETRDLTVWGRFMSTLDDDLEDAAQRMGLKLLPDPEPEKGYYYRADHFEFAKAGVPALSIGAGTDYVGRSVGWGLAQRQAYIAQRYHTPADVYEPGWDLSGMHQQLGVLYLSGANLAEGHSWPTWYKSGSFRAPRGTQRREDNPGS